jgi:cell division protein ZapA
LKQAVEVTILGHLFTVKSEASPDEMRRVAEFVNGKISEVMSISRSADSLNCAILALMNVSGAFLRLQDQVAEEGDEDVWGRLQALLNRIELADFDGEGAPGKGLVP